MDRHLYIKLFITHLCLLLLLVGSNLIIGYVGHQNNGLQQQRIEYQRQHLELMRQRIERDNSTATYKLTG